MPLTPADYRKTANIHRIGVDADRPAATDVLPGTLYFATDTFILSRSDGVTWTELPLVPNLHVTTHEDGGSDPISGDISPNFVNLIGGSLVFPYVHIPNFDPNALTDYLHSSYTPELTFGGANTGIVCDIQFAEFIKIGHFVVITVNLRLTSKGSATGNAEISLPYTSISIGGGFYTALSNMDASIVSGVYGTMVSTGTTIILTTPVSTGNLTVTDAHFTNTSAIVFVGFFFAD